MPKALVSFTAIPARYRQKNEFTLLQFTDPSLPYHVWAGWEVFTPPQRFSMPSPPNGVDLKYLLSGKATIEANGHGHHLSAGDLLFILGPGGYTLEVTATSEPCEALSWSFEGSDIYNHCRAFTLAVGQVHAFAPDDANLSPLYSLLMLTIDHRLSRAEAAAEMLYSWIMRLRASCLPDHTPIPAEVLRAERYLMMHFMDKITMASLVEVAGMSRSHLERRFRDAYGMSPMQYLLTQRTKHAIFLLLNTDSSVTEIAMQCGFYDQSYFTKVFTLRWGESPSAYRQRHRQIHKSPSSETTTPR